MDRKKQEQEYQLWDEHRDAIVEYGRWSMAQPKDLKIDIQLHEGTCVPDVIPLPMDLRQQIIDLMLTYWSGQARGIQDKVDQLRIK